MMSLFVPFHIDFVDTHETTFHARYRLGCMRLLYVSVEHKLLGVVLPASDALEGSMDAVSYSQMRNQSGDEVEFLLTQRAGFFATFESVIIRNKRLENRSPFKAGPAKLIQHVSCKIDSAFCFNTDICYGNYILISRKICRKSYDSLICKSWFSAQ